MSKSKNSKSKTSSKNTKIDRIAKITVCIIIGLGLALFGGTLGFLYGYDKELFFDILQIFTIDNGASDMGFLITVTISFLILLFITINMILAKKKIYKENFDDSENSYYSKHILKLSVLRGLSSIATMVNFTIVFLSLQSIFTDNLFSNMFYINLIACLNFFMVIIIECVLFNNIISKVQPEKYNNIFSFKFNSKYCDSLDEYEFKKSGKSAIKSVGMISWLFFALFAVGIIFQMGLQYYIGITLYQVVFIIVQIVNNVKNKVNLP